MKKIFLLPVILWLIVFALLMWAISPGSVLAAGSCVAQLISAPFYYEYYGGGPASAIHSQTFGDTITITYLCTGDSAAGTVPDTALTFLPVINSLYYELETIPGTGDAEPTVYSVTLKSNRGTTIAAVTGRSATLAETETIDTGPHVIDALPTLSVSDLGNSDTATIILKFIKRAGRL